MLPSWEVPEQARVVVGVMVVVVIHLHHGDLMVAVEYSTFREDIQKQNKAKQTKQKI